MSILLLFLNEGLVYIKIMFVFQKYIYIYICFFNKETWYGRDHASQERKLSFKSCYKIHPKFIYPTAKHKLLSSHWLFIYRCRSSKLWCLSKFGGHMSRIEDKCVKHTEFQNTCKTNCEQWILQRQNLKSINHEKVSEEWFSSYVRIFF